MVMAVGLIIAIGVNKKVWNLLCLIYVLTSDVHVNICFQVSFSYIIENMNMLITRLFFQTVEDEELIAPAISILCNLLQYNPNLRQHLAADLKAMLTLLRCESK